MMIGCAEICRAACCYSLRKIKLTEAQLANMKQKGGVLFDMQEKGGGVYTLRGRCPNLTSDDRCSVRGTSLQPITCKELRFMGGLCRDFRFNRERVNSVRVYFPEEIAVKEELLDVKAELKLFVASRLESWPWRVRSENPARVAKMYESV